MALSTKTRGFHTQLDEGPETPRATREASGVPFLSQCSCLGNPMDRGAWWGPWGYKESNTTKQLMLSLFHKEAAQRLVGAAKQPLGNAALGALFALTAFLRPPKVPRHAGFPRGEHRGSRHRFL